MDKSRITAISFDCYGTLIDWETGILSALGSAWRNAVMDDRLLAHFAKHESAVEREHPNWRYQDILKQVYIRMAREMGLPGGEAGAQSFARSVGDWPPFEDTVTALGRLKKHYQIFVLSNVDLESFTRTNARLGVEFDGVYTAEEIGSYKPDPNNFAYLIARLGERGIARHQILHAAQSLYHDMAPASAMGLMTAWVDRRGGKPGGATPAPSSQPAYNLRVESMAALSDALLSR